MSSSLLDTLRSIFPIWTDDDLLYVLLVHADGDFTTAVNTILRYEETGGQSPGELIRLLVGDSSTPRTHTHPQRRRSYSSNSLRSQSAEPVAETNILTLYRSRSERWVEVSSSGFVPPPASEGADTRMTRVFGQPFNIESQRMRNFSGPESVPHDVVGFRPIRRSSSASSSSSTALVGNLTQTEIANDETLALKQNPLRQGQDAEDDEKKGEKKSNSADMMQMIHMQSGIEASLSLEETPKTPAHGTDLDSGDAFNEALSQAVRASKETFYNEHRRRELRNEIEMRVINTLVAESASDPVQKSEEELISDALKKSLSDPVQKSEERLVQEAIDESLEDLERMNSIAKSEEELLEQVKLISLHTMTEEEKLIETVKSQSLKPSPLPDNLGKKPGDGASTGIDIARQSTSTTYPLSFGADEDDDSFLASSSLSGGEEECENGEYPLPSRFDSPLNSLDLSDLDRKMPALVLPPSLPAMQHGDNNGAMTMKSHSDPNVHSCSVAVGHDKADEDGSRSRSRSCS